MSLQLPGSARDYVVAVNAFLNVAECGDFCRRSSRRRSGC